MFRLENVKKVYEQDGEQIVALDSTDLEIQSGEFVAVVGPSGCGKSTLLTLLGGMAAPTEGKVWFDEKSLYDLSVRERTALRRTQMGFVFQSFNLVPYLTALQNVQMPLLLRGESRKCQHERAMDLLGQLGVGHRAKHKPCELSAGQQQRVALARTLANDPSVILADEPTGNLDPDTRDDVIAFFQRFHRAGKTIVMVTHDPQIAQRATRELKLVDGAVSSCAIEVFQCSA